MKKSPINPKKIGIIRVIFTTNDVLDRVELSGGWEEVVRAINNIAVLNVESVIDYCLMLDNRILAAKVGYFLEQREGAFAVSEKTLKAIETKKYLSCTISSNLRWIGVPSIMLVAKKSETL